MSEIRWEDPGPTGRHGRTDWETVLTPVMAHPRRWAMVAVFPTPQQAYSAAGGLRFGRIHKPPGRWEFTSRTVDGEYRLYARYLGPDEGGVS